MAKAIIDTNVMIHVLRGEQQAAKWFNILEEEVVFPCFVLMELIVGCDTKEELAKVEKLIKPRSVYWPSQKDIRKALEIVRDNYRHGRKVKVIDALIAACAMTLHIKLYTEDNDFNNIPGLKKHSPFILP